MSAIGLTAGLQALLGGMTEAGKQRRALQRESIDRGRENAKELYQLGQQAEQFRQAGETHKWGKDAAERAKKQEADRIAELERLNEERKNELAIKKGGYIRTNLAPIAQAQIGYDTAVADYNAIDPRDFLKKEAAYKALVKSRGIYESALATNKKLLKADGSYGITDWSPYIDTFALKDQLPARPTRISRIAPVTPATGASGAAGAAVEPSVTGGGVTLPAGGPLRSAPALPPPPPPPAQTSGLPFISPPMIGMPNVPLGANVPPAPAAQANQPYPFDPNAARNFLPDTGMLGSRGFILPATAPRSPMVAPRPATPPPPTWDESRNRLTKRFFPEEDYLEYNQLGELTPEVDKEVDRLIKKAGEGFTFPVDDTLHPSKWLPTVSAKFRERALNPAFLEAELSAMNYGDKRELIPHILERIGMKFRNDPTYLPADVRKALTDESASTADRLIKSKQEKRLDAAAAREALDWKYATGKGREMKEEEHKVQMEGARTVTAGHKQSQAKAQKEITSGKPIYEIRSNVSKIVDTDAKVYFNFMDAAEKRMAGSQGGSSGVYRRPQAGAAPASQGVEFAALQNMKARWAKIKTEITNETLSGDNTAIADMHNRWNDLKKEYVEKFPSLATYLGDGRDVNQTTGKPLKASSN